MALHGGACARATLLTTRARDHSVVSSLDHPNWLKPTERSTDKKSSRVRALNGGDSYLDMWKTAVERERKEREFQRIAENLAGSDGVDGDGEGAEEKRAEDFERKSREFQKILEVPKEERDIVQGMQVIDRAAAAIAAARAILEDSNLSLQNEVSNVSGTEIPSIDNLGGMEAQQKGAQGVNLLDSQSGGFGNGIPGPNFWSWTPPPERDGNLDDETDLKLASQAYSYPMKVNPLMEKERPANFLSIPFESGTSKRNYPPLPPLQSQTEIETEEVSASSQEMVHEEDEQKLGVQFSAHAAEAAHALSSVNEASTQGVNPDGSRWWKETGIDRRSDGVMCRWTLTRGVSADKAVEWEDKYWEAADEFGYRELGSEKSGRDAAGNVWREFWRESMWQERGLVHLEKTADKWGMNGNEEEWQEKWWEHYDASGQAEKWAHKWCRIDPGTPLEAGHAHVWHERWGEKYDGKGSSMKYTDKWAERSDGDGWSKWGDKWDEHFDINGHGVKQGETWWQGKYGECWNRTWGEHHNGSGWVHKYGKSSSGERWDTDVQQETWYERYPHYGFQHCFNNSVQLREVKGPSDWS
ncbi:hypothetical protein NMG60_11032076 [Bertholletia excelsa]